MSAQPPPPPTPAGARRPVPVPFGDEPTRQVDDDLLTALRNSVPAKPSPRVNTPKPGAPKPTLPRPSVVRPAAPDDPTRMAHVDSLGINNSSGADGAARSGAGPSQFRPSAPPDPGLGSFDPEESTRLASLDSLAAMERARNHGPSNDERTRAVNIRNDPSISDIDWDLD
jgi:hypothetical protein